MACIVPDSCVCILDYGSGNVRSVANLLESLSVQVSVSNAVEDIQAATHLILPGVGAFPSSLDKMRVSLPIEALSAQVRVKGTPFLGICVGMQALATLGLEFFPHPGLDWIPGQVVRLDTLGLPLPHVGWNDLQIERESPLLDSLGSSPDFYFVHSYVFEPVDGSVVVASAQYGQTFPAVIQQKNICGCQFHPEKSQFAGRRFLVNFLGSPQP